MQIYIKKEEEEEEELERMRERERWRGWGGVLCVKKIMDENGTGNWAGEENYF